MAYVIGQYNHNSASGDDASFITPIRNGRVARKDNSGDTGVIGNAISTFSDECITDLNLTPSKYYYFRCQVKRMIDAQTFTVKLINYNSSAVSNVEQFIKQITVRGGDREEWADRWKRTQPGADRQ